MLLNVTNLFTFGRVCAAERVLSLVVCVTTSQSASVILWK